MIRINLLPFRAARKRENIKRQLTFYALSVFLTLLVILYFFIDITGQLSDLKAEEKKIKVELATYEKTIKEINALEKKIKDLKTKLGVIRDLEKGKTGPVKLLDEISIAVPKDRLWLTSFSEKKGSLSLRGMAMNNDTVAEFMTNLENSKIITGVDLNSSTLNRVKGQNVNAFVIDCKTYAYKTKGPEKKKKKRKK